MQIPAIDPLNYWNYHGHWSSQWFNEILRGLDSMEASAGQDANLAQYMLSDETWK